MKRVLFDISEFDFKYIYQVLKHDSFFAKEVIDKELYDDDDEKTLFLFCSKHSKFLANKFLSFIEGI